MKERNHALETSYPADLTRLKRLARFLQGDRDCAIYFPRGDLLAPLKDSQTLIGLEVNLRENQPLQLR